MQYYIANWKSNKTLAEAVDWFEQINLTEDPDREVVVCPPFPYAQQCAEVVKQRNLPIKLGMQDISAFPFGAYTGAVTVEMIKEWATCVIVGHSERRKYFHETSQEVANKVRMVAEARLRPVVCVDEPYVVEQMAAIEKEFLPQCIVAYEPVSAIGSGQTDTPEHANQVAELIRREAAAELPVLYGGSVKPDNVGLFLNQELISGVLVGGASLEVESWEGLVR